MIATLKFLMLSFKMGNSDKFENVFDCIVNPKSEIGGVCNVIFLMTSYTVTWTILQMTFCLRSHNICLFCLLCTICLIYFWAHSLLWEPTYILTTSIDPLDISGYIGVDTLFGLAATSESCQFWWEHYTFSGSSLDSVYIWKIYVLQHYGYILLCIMSHFLSTNCIQFIF